MVYAFFFSELQAAALKVSFYLDSLTQGRICTITKKTKKGLKVLEKFY